MCTRPLLAFPDGKTESGANHYRIMSYRDALKCLATDHSVGYVDIPKDSRILQIPCGKCKECRLRYAKVWSDRCMLESQFHESSYFLTLTYDDVHLPSNMYGYPTLVKKDFQDFLKRLRARLPYQIRFYMCGEYGTHTRRPHYHAIIFGLYLDDLVFYKRSPAGDILYSSPFLEEVWSNGYVVVGDVTPQSCGYVARYVSKKVGVDLNEVYAKTGIQREYTSMSLKPGIGKKAYSPDMFRKGYVCVSTEKGGLKIYPPRYFEKFYESDCPEEFLEFKESRVSRLAFKSISSFGKNSQQYCDYLEDVEADLEARTSSLVRNQI